MSFQLQKYLSSLQSDDVTCFMGCLHVSYSTAGHEDYHTLKCDAMQSSRHLWDRHRIVLRQPETKIEGTMFLQNTGHQSSNDRVS